MSNTSLLGSYGGLGSSGLTFRNILINGEVTRINQRGFGGNWAALSVGEYGYDRWKKAGTDTMSQVVEEGNFIPGAQYTLSGTNVTTQTLTAPSSGHWTITVQQTARFVMLEAGPVATPFEHRPIGMELSLAQRYYEVISSGYASTGGTSTIYFIPKIKVQKRKGVIASTDVGISATSAFFINNANYNTTSAGTSTVSSSNGEIVWVGVTGFTSLPVPGNGFFNGGTFTVNAEL